MNDLDYTQVNEIYRMRRVMRTGVSRKKPDPLLHLYTSRQCKH